MDMEKFMEEYEDVFVIELPEPRWWRKRPRWWATFRVRLWLAKKRLVG